MNKTLTILLLCIINYPGICQQEENLKKPIEDLFSTFISRDSSLARNTMVSNAVLFSMKTQKESMSIEYEGIDNFIKFIGNKQRPDVAEPVWNYKIMQDGELGFVWVDYAFYLNGTLREILSGCVPVWSQSMDSHQPGDSQAGYSPSS